MDQQHLFSLYVHLPPNKTLEGPPSIFNGREIPNSIVTGAASSARPLLCLQQQHKTNISATSVSHVRHALQLLQVLCTACGRHFFVQNVCWEGHSGPPAGLCMSISPRN